MQRVPPFARVLLCVLALAACAATAVGAEAKHDAHGASENQGGGHEEAKSGDIAIFKEALDLGIWSLVVFLLLLFILTKYAWKPMLEGLRKREESIYTAIREADEARVEAHRLRDQFQVEFNNAHNKVREIMDDARRDAERTTQDMIAKARSEIQSERDRLRREIATARDQALQELWNQTAQLATLISSKAIRRQLSPDDHRRLVDDALGDLRKAGTQWQSQGAGGRA